MGAVQALRTLFNVAHRLAPLLGPSWPRVLETLDALDRILHSPRTTTQVHLCPFESHWTVTKSGCVSKDAGRAGPYPALPAHHHTGAPVPSLNHE